MSNLQVPVICGTCRKSSASCLCRPLTSQQLWTHATQLSTPHRPQLQSSLVSQSLTPHARPPHVQYYVSSVSQPLYDTRIHPGYYSGLPYNLALPAGPPATPQSIATPAAARHPVVDHAHIPSPNQHSPDATRMTTKRKRTNGAPTASKRQRRAQPVGPPAPDENTNPSTLSIPSVGPSSSSVGPPAARPHPIADYHPISKADKKLESKQSATDVWYFMRPLKQRERPSDLEQLPQVEPFRHKPRTSFVGCRLCPFPEKWSVWANINGIADTIRTHLSTKHKEEWCKTVVSEKLKGWNKLNGEIKTSQASAQELFTMEGFLKRLIQWIAVDDQSLNVIESDELRDLILYLNNNLCNEDIPGRTRLTELIFKNYHCEWNKLVDELQAKYFKHAMGRISFTSDLWSDPNLKSYMAITAHFCSSDKHGNLIIYSRLVAFRHISGTHTGMNLAQYFFAILKELGVLHKIGMITLDNASNCQTMMEDLARLLQEQGLLFNAEENRIRCFPHVVNIAVKAALKELSKSAPDIMNEDDIPLYNESNISDVEYNTALKSDPIAKCRSLVAICRASGQRREDLQATIKEGNLSKAFLNGRQIRNVQLLRDVDTRWSSVYLMIDRVLELYPAIDVLLNKVKYRDIHRYLLDEAELRVLRDIAEFLKIPHAVQTLLCAEKVPTLATVLPAYEDLLQMLRAFKIICPQLNRAVSTCITRIEEYVNKSRKTRIYTLAMIINPITKLAWIEDHWTNEEHQAARAWILQAMFEYRKASRHKSTAKAMTTQSQSVPHAPSSSAMPIPSEQSQAKGLSYLRALKTSLQRSVSQILASPDSGVNQVDFADITHAPTLSRTETDIQADETLADEKDRVAVAEELQQYIAEGILDEVDLKDFSLLRYWQANKYRYPMLYQVALDILPVQASSVACERVFSSSKETITMRRACLSPALVEALQFLKYTYRQQRLNLMEGFVLSEEEILSMDIPTTSTAEVQNLFLSNKVDFLVELLAKESSGNTVETAVS